MTVLAPREAYRRWAPTYDAENAFSVLERDLVDALSPSPRGQRLLDVGCGTGRRLAGTGAASAVGVEPSAEMLEAGRQARAFGAEVRLIEGDARALQLPDAAFDLVWCRLMIGHVPQCGAVYRELGRVTASGGRVVVTDFHPAAHANGMRRTFRDGADLFEVEHHVHSLDAHRAAAAEAGLALLASATATVGGSIRRYFQSCGKLEIYQQLLGLPIVLGMCFGRDG
jgi:malonyl-CoA O-methyltransferase